MKVLLDSCVRGKAVFELTDAGHDVVWVGDWPTDPGDEEILQTAHRESRILVTLDKDFGELAIVRGIPHSGIVRLVGFQARLQAVACAEVLSLHGDELLAGAVVTAEPGRMRIRAPEVES